MLQFYFDFIYPSLVSLIVQLFLFLLILYYILLF